MRKEQAGWPAAGPCGVRGARWPRPRCSRVFNDPRRFAGAVPAVPAAADRPGCGDQRLDPLLRRRATQLQARIRRRPAPALLALLGRRLRHVDHDRLSAARRLRRGADPPAAGGLPAPGRRAAPAYPLALPGARSGSGRAGRRAAGSRDRRQPGDQQPGRGVGRATARLPEQARSADELDRLPAELSRAGRRRSGPVGRRAAGRVPGLSVAGPAARRTVRSGCGRSADDDLVSGGGWPTTRTAADRDHPARRSPQTEGLAYIERQQQRLADGAGWSFADRRAVSTDQAVGSAGLWLNPDRPATAGYAVAPRFRGRGYANGGADGADRVRLDPPGDRPGRALHRAGEPRPRSRSPGRCGYRRRGVWCSTQHAEIGGRLRDTMCCAVEPLNRLSCDRAAWQDCAIAAAKSPAGAAPILRHRAYRAGRLPIMKVGVPSEVKNHEYRVAITPSGVHEFIRHGHEVLVQAGAGLGSSITDDEFVAAGATIAADARAGVGRGRDDPEGQGADRGRVRPDAAGPDPVHLPAPGRQSGLHPGPAGPQGHRDRVRDGPAARRRAAAAGPDERGGRPAGAAGRARTT